MHKNELHAALFHQRFAVEVSKRYHAHRIDALVRVCGVLQMVELIASTAALASTFAWSVTLTRGLILVAGLSAGLAYVKKLHTSIARHYEKKAAFGALAMRFPVVLEKETDDLLADVVKERERIERDDTAGFECLDVLMHNQVCRVWGCEDAVKPMTWMQRHVGVILPLRYHEPRERD